MLARLRGKRVLLLQGPMGPFFSRLAKELTAQGAQVTKVHFNAGDALFYRGRDVVHFRGEAGAWQGAFRELVHSRRAQAVVLFGDSRPLHRVASEVARELGLAVYVFEEGYLRPDCITIEEGGVNHNSHLPKDPSAYATFATLAPRLRPVGNTYRYLVFFSICYSLATTFFWWLYPHYRHHKKVGALYQFGRGWVGAGRYVWYALRERGVLQRLRGEGSKRYFLVALQVHDDYQVKNSRFANVPAFIAEVVASFAKHAKPEHQLVFKHHPLDRSYRDYTSLLVRLGREHGIADRIVYVHDLHLPTLLRHARATIVLNSTVGFSSLFHGTPVKVLDQAVYDIPGLTVGLPLDQLWTARLRVDLDMFRRVRAAMIVKTQANGSFYRRLPGTGPAGVFWPGSQGVDAAAESSDDFEGPDSDDFVPDSETASSRPPVDAARESHGTAERR